jgi:hypothetical protein
MLHGAGSSAKITPRNGVTAKPKDFGDSAHTDTTDAHKMDVFSFFVHKIPNFMGVTLPCPDKLGFFKINRTFLIYISNH